MANTKCCSLTLKIFVSNKVALSEYIIDRAIDAESIHCGDSMRGWQLLLMTLSHVLT